MQLELEVARRSPTGQCQQPKVRFSGTLGNTNGSQQVVTFQIPHSTHDWRKNMNEFLPNLYFNLHASLAKWS